MADGNSGNSGWSDLRTPAQRRARRIRLTRKVGYEVFDARLAGSHSDSVLFTQFHDVCRRVIHCVTATHPWFALHTILAKVAMREHELKRADFDDLTGVIHRAGWIETINAIDAAVELQLSYTKATKRRFRKVGKIHRATAQGLAALALEELYHERITIDWLALPYNPERFAAFPEIEQVYQRWLAADKKMYPSIPDDGGDAEG